jgi:hypothetical protein
MALKAWQELGREIGASVGDSEKVREALDRLGEEKLRAEVVRAVRELVIDALKAHERLLEQELTDWTQEHSTWAMGGARYETVEARGDCDADSRLVPIHRRRADARRRSCRRRRIAEHF